MNFGVPSQRASKKEELHPTTPVLTIGIDGGKGTSRTMLLNSTAVSVLGLAEVSAVAFAFEGKQVFITNGNQPGIPEEYQIRVTKGNPRKISEKRTYTYLSEKVFELDNSIENHFELKEVDNDEAIKTFELVLITNEGGTVAGDSIPSVDSMVEKFSEVEDDTIKSESFIEATE